MYDLEELYDTSPEPDPNEEPELNDDLTQEELGEVELFKQLKMGVMIITGEPGAGKDTVMHFILWKLRTLFKDFKVFLDRKPRMLFGQYIPFDEEILLEEMARLDDKYKTGESDIHIDFARYSKNKEHLNEVINSWLGNAEDTFFNSGIGLQEFWRYFYNREPHNAMNRALHPFLKRYRHYKMLIIGTTPHPDELDVKSCLKYVTHEINCSQTATKGVHIASVFRRRFYNGQSLVQVAAPPIHLIVDALKPRDRLDGGYIYQLFNSYERGEFQARRA